MAESSLSISYPDLLRAISRYLGKGPIYNAGTVAIASGVVTLTSGTFPSWAAEGSIVAASSSTPYSVSTRDGDTQVTLDDTSVTVSSGSPYVLLRADEPVAVLINDAIEVGYRRFLYPQMLEGQEAPYQWSFLKINDTLALSSSDFDYDLPDDCGQDTESWTYDSGTTQNPIALIDDGELRAMRSQDSASGAPQYVAIRPKYDALLVTGQRFEAIFYPTPDDSYTVSYDYNVIPGMLSPKLQFPHVGGGVHAETLRTSVLAAAEEIFEDDKRVYAAQFQAQLTASIQIDARAGRVEARSYQNTAVTYGTYDWFAQEIGRELDLSPNPKTWNHPTQQKVDSIIQRGLEQFYHLPFPDMHHRWSFLRPVTTISTVAEYSTGTVAISSGVVTLTGGTWPSWAADGELQVDGVSYTVNTRDSDTQLTLDDTSVDEDAGASYVLAQLEYDLPNDFGGIDGPITYRPGTSYIYPAIELVSEQQIRQMRQSWDTTTRPRWAAIRAKTLDTSAGTRWQILFWPAPDADYKLYYRYRKKPAVLASGEYPAGGTENAEVILESCLDIISKGRNRNRFMEKLKAAVQLDQMEHTPETLGYNGDRSDSYWDYYFERPSGHFTSYNSTVP